MSKALSLDLRLRVLAAVAEGLSHRAAAARFGVSAASVSRWRRRAAVEGDPRPRALGGDRRSGRIEAHSDVILGVLAETPDIAIEELRRSLAGRGGSREDRGRWRRAPDSPALQPRPEPHRNGLLKAQVPVTKSCRAHRRRPLESHRDHPRNLRATGMQELLRRRRL